MTIATILILAITVEALVEYFKLIVIEKTINWKQIAAIVLSVFLAVAANVDLYQILKINFIIPYVGIVLTGILFSRGANFFADFVKLTQTTSAGMAAYVRESAYRATPSIEAPVIPEEES